MTDHIIAKMRESQLDLSSITTFVQSFTELESKSISGSEINSKYDYIKKNGGAYTISTGFTCESVDEFRKFLPGVLEIENDTILTLPTITFDNWSFQVSFADEEMWKYKCYTAGSPVLNELIMKNGEDNYKFNYSTFEVKRENGVTSLIFEDSDNTVYYRLTHDSKGLFSEYGTIGGPWFNPSRDAEYKVKLSDAPTKAEPKNTTIQPKSYFVEELIKSLSTMQTDFTGVQNYLAQVADLSNTNLELIEDPPGRISSGARYSISTRTAINDQNILSFLTSELQCDKDSKLKLPSMNFNKMKITLAFDKSEYKIEYYNTPTQGFSSLSYSDENQYTINVISLKIIKDPNSIKAVFEGEGAENYQLVFKDNKLYSEVINIRPDSAPLVSNLIYTVEPKTDAGDSQPPEEEKKEETIPDDRKFYLYFKKIQEFNDDKRKLIKLLYPTTGMPPDIGAVTIHDPETSPSKFLNGKRFTIKVDGYLTAEHLNEILPPKLDFAFDSNFHIDSLRIKTIEIDASLDSSEFIMSITVPSYLDIGTMSYDLDEGLEDDLIAYNIDTFTIEKVGKSSKLTFANSVNAYILEHSEKGTTSIVFKKKDGKNVFIDGLKEIDGQKVDMDEEDRTSGPLRNVINLLNVALRQTQVREVTVVQNTVVTFPELRNVSSSAIDNTDNLKQSRYGENGQRYGFSGLIASKPAHIKLLLHPLLDFTLDTFVSLTKLIVNRVALDTSFENSDYNVQFDNYEKDVGYIDLITISYDVSKIRGTKDLKTFNSDNVSLSVDQDKISLQIISNDYIYELYHDIIGLFSSLSNVEDGSVIRSSKLKDADTTNIWVANAKKRADARAVEEAKKAAEKKTAEEATKKAQEEKKSAEEAALKLEEAKVEKAKKIVKSYFDNVITNFASSDFTSTFAFNLESHKREDIHWVIMTKENLTLHDFLAIFDTTKLFLADIKDNIKLSNPKVEKIIFKEYDSSVAYHHMYLVLEDTSITTSFKEFFNLSGNPSPEWAKQGDYNLFSYSLSFEFTAKFANTYLYLNSDPASHIMIVEDYLTVHNLETQENDFSKPIEFIKTGIDKKPFTIDFYEDYITNNQEVSLDSKLPFTASKIDVIIEEQTQKIAVLIPNEEMTVDQIAKYFHPDVTPFVSHTYLMNLQQLEIEKVYIINSTTNYFQYLYIKITDDSKIDDDNYVYANYRDEFEVYGVISTLQLAEGVDYNMVMRVSRHHPFNVEVNIIADSLEDLGLTQLYSVWWNTDNFRVLQFSVPKYVKPYSYFTKPDTPPERPQELSIPTTYPTLDQLETFFEEVEKKNFTEINDAREFLNTQDPVFGHFVPAFDETTNKLEIRTKPRSTFTFDKLEPQINEFSDLKKMEQRVFVEHSQFKIDEISSFVGGGRTLVFKMKNDIKIEYLADGVTQHINMKISEFYFDYVKGKRTLHFDGEFLLPRDMDLSVEAPPKDDYISGTGYISVNYLLNIYGPNPEDNSNLLYHKEVLRELSITEVGGLMDFLAANYFQAKGTSTRIRDRIWKEIPELGNNFYPYDVKKDYDQYEDRILLIMAYDLTSPTDAGFTLEQIVRIFGEGELTSEITGLLGDVKKFNALIFSDSIDQYTMHVTAYRLSEEYQPLSINTETGPIVTDTTANFQKFIEPLGNLRVDSSADNFKELGIPISVTVSQDSLQRITADVQFLSEISIKTGKIFSDEITNNKQFTGYSFRKNGNTVNSTLTKKDFSTVEDLSTPQNMPYDLTRLPVALTSELSNFSEIYPSLDKVKISYTNTERLIQFKDIFKIWRKFERDGLMRAEEVYTSQSSWILNDNLPHDFVLSELDTTLDKIWNLFFKDTFTGNSRIHTWGSKSIDTLEIHYNEYLNEYKLIPRKSGNNLTIIVTHKGQEVKCQLFEIQMRKGILSLAASSEKRFYRIIFNDGEALLFAGDQLPTFDKKVTIEIPSENSEDFWIIPKTTTLLMLNGMGHFSTAQIAGETREDTLFSDSAVPTEPTSFSENLPEVKNGEIEVVAVERFQFSEPDLRKLGYRVIHMQPSSQVKSDSFFTLLGIEKSVFFTFISHAGIKITQLAIEGMRARFMDFDEYTEDTWATAFEVIKFEVEGKARFKDQSVSISNIEMNNSNSSITILGDYENIQTLEILSKEGTELVPNSEFKLNIPIRYFYDRNENIGEKERVQYQLENRIAQLEQKKKQFLDVLDTYFEGRLLDDLYKLCTSEYAAVVFQQNRVVDFALENIDKAGHFSSISRSMIDGVLHVSIIPTNVDGIFERLDLENLPRFLLSHQFRPDFTLIKIEQIIAEYEKKKLSKLSFYVKDGVYNTSIHDNTSLIDVNLNKLVLDISGRRISAFMSFKDGDGNIEKFGKNVHYLYFGKFRSGLAYNKGGDTYYLRNEVPDLDLLQSKAIMSIDWDTRTINVRELIEINFKSVPQIFDPNSMSQKQKEYYNAWYDSSTKTGSTRESNMDESSLISTFGADVANYYRIVDAVKKDNDKDGHFYELKIAAKGSSKARVVMTEFGSYSHFVGLSNNQVRLDLDDIETSNVTIHFLHMNKNPSLLEFYVSNEAKIWIHNNKYFEKLPIETMSVDYDNEVAIILAGDKSKTYEITKQFNGKFTLSKFDYETYSYEIIPDEVSEDDIYNDPVTTTDVDWFEHLFALFNNEPQASDTVEVLKTIRALFDITEEADALLLTSKLTYSTAEFFNDIIKVPIDTFSGIVIPEMMDSFRVRYPTMQPHEYTLEMLCKGKSLSIKWLVKTKEGKRVSNNLIEVDASIIPHANIFSSKVSNSISYSISLDSDAIIYEINASTQTRKELIQTTSNAEIDWNNLGKELIDKKGDPNALAKDKSLNKNFTVTVPQSTTGLKVELMPKKDFTLKDMINKFMPSGTIFSPNPDVSLDMDMTISKIIWDIDTAERKFEIGAELDGGISFNFFGRKLMISNLGFKIEGHFTSGTVSADDTTDDSEDNSEVSSEDQNEETEMPAGLTLGDFQNTFQITGTIALSAGNAKIETNVELITGGDELALRLELDSFSLRDIQKIIFGGLTLPELLPNIELTNIVIRGGKSDDYGHYFIFTATHEVLGKNTTLILGALPESEIEDEDEADDSFDTDDVSKDEHANIKDESSDSEDEDQSEEEKLPIEKNGEAKLIMVSFDGIGELAPSAINSVLQPLDVLSFSNADIRYSNFAMDPDIHADAIEWLELDEDTEFDAGFYLNGRVFFDSSKLGILGKYFNLGTLDVEGHFMEDDLELKIDVDKALSVLGITVDEGSEFYYSQSEKYFTGSGSIALPFGIVDTYPKYNPFTFDAIKLEITEDDGEETIVFSMSKDFDIFKLTLEGEKSSDTNTVGITIEKSIQSIYVSDFLPSSLRRVLSSSETGRHFGEVSQMTGTWDRDNDTLELSLTLEGTFNEVIFGIGVALYSPKGKVIIHNLLGNNKGLTLGMSGEVAIGNFRFGIEVEYGHQKKINATFEKLDFAAFGGALLGTNMAPWLTTVSPALEYINMDNVTIEFASSDGNYLAYFSAYTTIGIFKIGFIKTGGHAGLVVLAKIDGTDEVLSKYNISQYLDAVSIEQLTLMFATTDLNVSDLVTDFATVAGDKEDNQKAVTLVSGGSINRGLTFSSRVGINSNSDALATVTDLITVDELDLSITFGAKLTDIYVALSLGKGMDIGGFKIDDLALMLNIAKRKFFLRGSKTFIIDNSKLKFFLDMAADKTGGALALQLQGLWRGAFGLDWLDIGDLKFIVSKTEDSFEIGAQGKVVLGGKEFVIGAGFKSGSYVPVYFQLSLNDTITLKEVLQIFIKTAMPDLLDTIEIIEPEIYYCTEPLGFDISPTETLPFGLRVKVGFQFFGFEVHGMIEVTTTSIYMKAYTSPLNVTVGGVNILSLKASKKDPNPNTGPSFELSIKPPTVPSVGLSGRVVLFEKYSADFFTSLSSNGIKMYFEIILFGFETEFQLEVGSSWDEATFKARLRLDFYQKAITLVKEKLDQWLPGWLSPIVDAFLSVNPWDYLFRIIAASFEGSLGGMNGNKFNMEFEVSFLAKTFKPKIEFDFDDIPGSLFRLLKEVFANVSNVFGAILELLANMGAFIAHLFVEAGKALLAAAKAIGEGVMVAAEAVAGAITDAADAVVEGVSIAGKAIASFASDAAKAVATAISQAAEAIAEALVQALDAVMDAIANTLSAIGDWFSCLFGCSPPAPIPAIVRDAAKIFPFKSTITNMYLKTDLPQLREAGLRSFYSGAYGQALAMFQEAYKSVVPEKFFERFSNEDISTYKVEYRTRVRREDTLMMMWFTPNVPHWIAKTMLVMWDKSGNEKLFNINPNARVGGAIGTMEKARTGPDVGDYIEDSLRCYPKWYSGFKRVISDSEQFGDRLNFMSEGTEYYLKQASVFAIKAVLINAGKISGNLELTKGLMYAALTNYRNGMIKINNEKYNYIQVENKDRFQPLHTDLDHVIASLPEFEIFSRRVEPLKSVFQTVRNDGKTYISPEIRKKADKYWNKGPNFDTVTMAYYRTIWETTRDPLALLKASYMEGSLHGKIQDSRTLHDLHLLGNRLDDFIATHAKSYFKQLPGGIDPISTQGAWWEMEEFWDVKPDPNNKHQVLYSKPAEVGRYFRGYTSQNQYNDPHNSSTMPGKREQSGIKYWVQFANQYFYAVRVTFAELINSDTLDYYWAHFYKTWLMEVNRTFTDEVKETRSFIYSLWSAYGEGAASRKFRLSNIYGYLDKYNSFVIATNGGELINEAIKDSRVLTEFDLKKMQKERLQYLGEKQRIEREGG